jgi:flagellar hook-associated protein 2
MSSSVSSLSSVLAPTFTGVSKFGTSLQQVLSRAVGIASLPLDSLNAGLTTLNAKQTAIGTLNGAFSSLQNSAALLQTALSSTLLNSSISDAGVVSAAVGSGATPGTYSVEVLSLGAYSTALSVAPSTPVSDPTTQGLGGTLPLTLNTGGSNIILKPASSSLQDLAAAINSQAGASVQATLVNTGSTTSPNYRLSLRAANLGTSALTLTDASGTNLIATSTNGTQASYKVDGLSTPITSDNRTVTLAPGLTVSLLSQSVPGQATTITVSDNADGLASAFDSFAQTYNNAIDAVNQNHGQSGGALQGDSLLQSLTRVLSQLGTYDNGTPASALANYGVTVDKTGKLTVDSNAFQNAANANFPALLAVLGSSTGGGFLKKAADLLSSVEDPITGSLVTESATLTSEIARQQTKIGDEQAIISTLQSNLTAQISKADAAIASLESQVTYVTGLFGSFTGATNTQANGLSSL